MIEYCGRYHSRFKKVCMANCVCNVPRGPNTGPNSSCAYTLGTSYKVESACGYDHIWGGALCNDPVSRFTMSLITRVSSVLGHTLLGAQVGSSGRGPWLTS